MLAEVFKYICFSLNCWHVSIFTRTVLRLKKEPQPYHPASRAFARLLDFCLQRLYINRARSLLRMLALGKPVWREKTRSKSPEVRVAVTSKSWRDTDRVFFSTPWSRRQKEALLAGCKHMYKLFFFFLHQGYSVSGFSDSGFFVREFAS